MLDRWEHFVWLYVNGLYVQICRSSERYWMASEMCSLAMFSAPAKSAIVRATLRIWVLLRQECVTALRLGW